MVNMGYYCVIFSALDLESNTKVAVKNLKCEGEGNLKAEYDNLMLLAPFNYSPTPLAFGAVPDDISFYATNYQRSKSLLFFHSLVALKSIHEAGIVHGDVTVMNIGVPKSLGKGRIIYYDFGYSIPIEPISCSRDISNLLMVTGRVSKENRTLSECRDAFENEPSTTVETLIEMVSEETMFDLEAAFD
ncbi:unnamed protein product [Caenorhabditis nigoni]